MISRLMRSAIAFCISFFAMSFFVTTTRVQAASSLNVSGAVSWTEGQQKSDGGFEMAGIPGFETPDAAFAIGEAANSGKAAWDSCAARNAVLLKTTSNNSALRYLDNFVDSSGSTLSAAVAGQLSFYVRALGYDAASFDPDGDGAANLLQLVDASKNPDGSFGPAGSFATTLWAVLGKITNSQPVDPKTTAYILGTQQSNGGFNYAGDKTQTGVDIDTTGRTLQALGALGMTASDTPIKNALAFLANNQKADGGFQGDFQTESNASSTALVLMGFKAVDVDSSNSSWRDTAVPALAGTPYTDPQAQLATRQVLDGHVTTEFDTSFFDTLGTTQSIQAAVDNFLPGVTPAPVLTLEDCPAVLGNTISSGGDAGRYRFAFANGTVLECHPNQQCTTASQITHLNKPIVAAAVTNTGGGYWLFATDGGVFAYGDANFYGSAAHINLQKPIVSAQPLPNDNGYILFAADGGVFTYGAANYFGSGVTLHLHDIVGGAMTHSGNGYWLFGRDGGVFTYGDAQYYGSAADLPMQGHVVSGDASSSGNGYALFASDGGVFTYGDQPYSGSAAALPLQSPIIKGFVDRLSGGYVMLSGDAGVFVYGNNNYVVSLAPNHSGVRDLMIG
jgi:hypothetical protein